MRTMSFRSLLSAGIILIFINVSFAQSENDCEELKKTIRALQDELVAAEKTAKTVSESLEKTKANFAKADKALEDFDKITKGKTGFWGTFDETWVTEKRREIVLHRSNIKRILEDLKKQLEDLNREIQATKDFINDLLNALGDCGKNKTENSPTPKPSVSPGPTVTSGGTPTISASSINCDCANTEAPNIGGAAVRQCLKAEGILKAKATAGQLKLDVVDGKIVGGDVCDYVTAGPAAWPVKGKPAEP